MPLPGGGHVGAGVIPRAERRPRGYAEEPQRRHVEAPPFSSTPVARQRSSSHRLAWSPR